MMCYILHTVDRSVGMVHKHDDVEWCVPFFAARNLSFKVLSWKLSLPC
jgi:hypothetical protein